MKKRLAVALFSGKFFTRIINYLIGNSFFAIPIFIRKKLFSGDKYYCPICDLNLRKFVSFYRPYHLFCPICQSLHRHRFIWIFIQKFELLKIKPIKILHIAPEVCLKNKFVEIENLEYVNIDLNNPEAMLKMDVSNLEFDSNIFDIVICSHVLEHVENDIKAMQEIFRVLKPNGIALILVPISHEQTIEDTTITDPKQRELIFGQYDHLRLYGIDIIDRLQEVGFNITEYKPHDIASNFEIQKMGLNPKDIIFFCEKKSKNLI